MSVPEPAAAPVATLAELPFYLAARFDRPMLMRRCVGESVEAFSTREFVDQVRAVSLELHHLGVGSGDRVAVVCESRPEWSIADLAIQTTGAVNVPVYPTLSTTQTQFILQDAGVKAVFVSDDVQLAKLLDIAPELPGLSAVVVVAPGGTPPTAAAGGPVVRSLRETVASGRARVAADASEAARYEERARHVAPGDVATIIYTSGTTGHPKGVVLTHRNILSNLMAVNAIAGIRGDDEPMSFLPLSHVFERLALYMYLLLGCPVAFAAISECIPSPFGWCPTGQLEGQSIKARSTDGPRLGSRATQPLEEGFRTCGNGMAVGPPPAASPDSSPSPSGSVSCLP
jgi:long-chain acyl-CoA synthetase